MSQESHTLAAGALVEARGSRWRVVEVIDHGTCQACRLVGASPSNLGVSRTLLAPFDRVRPATRPSRPRLAGRRRWVLGLRALLSLGSEADDLAGVARAGIDLLAYQLEPALACARGATRVLVADEVGLGKTIQAGVVLADLHARFDSLHALVLCPAGLAFQWRRELDRRFGLPAEIVDLPALRRLAAVSPAGPWERLPVAIASFDFVKQPEVLAGMDGVRWDLLVVDEAHLCAVAPGRSAAVRALGSRARRVVLLTATPHSGDAAAFDALCDIGRLAGDGPIEMFRRTRAGLGLAATRRARVLHVGLSGAEQRMHALLERYASRVWSAPSDGRPHGDARLAMVVLRKRAASGPWPLLVSLSRRLHWLGRPDAASAAQLSLPLGDTDAAESADDESWRVLAAPGLPDPGAERRALERLIESARAAAAGDSKCRALARLLRRAREPAIVFTEYRDTLEHLARALGRQRRLAVVHGGLDPAARADAVDAFTGGGVDLLLATDAAAHGLNLQARCRLVVHLELPWNPVRLEQRVGRVDRIGQRRTVHAVHLVAGGTGEEQVLARLALRARRAREALAGGPQPAACLSEIEMAESLFAGAMLPTPSTQPDTGHGPTPVAGVADAAAPLPHVSRADLSADAARQTARLETFRRLARRPDQALASALAELDRVAPWCARLRLRAGTARCPAVLALFRAEIVDGRGSLVERPLVAVRGPWPAEAAEAWRAARPHRLPGWLMAALRAGATRAVETRLDELRAVLPPRVAPLRARESALATLADRPMAAIQPGLFDRRALRQAARQRQVESALAEAGRAQADALAACSNLALAGPPRAMLVALVEGGWPEG